MKNKNLFVRVLALAVICLAFALATSEVATAGDGEVTKPVYRGETLDLYAGRCGVYLMNAPSEGKAILSRVEPTRARPKFVQDPCVFEFEVSGKSLKPYSGYLIYYINLTGTQYSEWLDGDLAMFVNGSQCSAFLLPSMGENGRVACWSQQPGAYGLVDISPDDEDNDDDKKDKDKPDGEWITAGQTLQLFDGRCGATLFNLPENGYVNLENQAGVEHRGGLKFAQKACDLSYTDSDENEISTINSHVLTSIKLTQELYDMWQDGDLSMAIYNGSTWKDCNPHWVSGGSYGKLMCRSHTVGMFNLVDIGIDEDDNDE